MPYLFLSLNSVMCQEFTVKTPWSLTVKRYNTEVWKSSMPPACFVGFCTQCFNFKIGLVRTCMHLTGGRKNNKCLGGGNDFQSKGMSCLSILDILTFLKHLWQLTDGQHPVQNTLDTCTSFYIFMCSSLLSVQHRARFKKLETSYCSINMIIWQ